MEENNTYKNKELWDDISRLVDESARKAHRQEEVKRLVTSTKGKPWKREKSAKKNC